MRFESVLNSAAVAASSTNVVSRPCPMSFEDSKNPWFAIEFSVLAQGTGITVKLQEQFPGAGNEWRDVGSEASVAISKKIFVGDTGVDPTTNIITSTAHGFLTGDLLYIAANGATLPTGVTAGLYYCIKVDDDTFKLATSFANALAGTAVDITVDGSGNCAAYAARYTIRMMAEDAEDAAQLPTAPAVRVVVATGSSDTATVAGCWQLRR